MRDSLLGVIGRLRRALIPVVAWFRATGIALGHLWRRSLQLRVIVSTLTLSLIVITILGVVLTSQITSRLVDDKISAAVEEMDRARNTVQDQLTGAHDVGQQQQRLADAREALSARGGVGRVTGAAGSFDSALSIIGGTPQQQIQAGPMQKIPEGLRRFVQRNQVSYQFATVSDPDGYAGRALIIGSPVASVPTLEIYLIFPLSNEERSLSLMRGTMLIGAVVLLVLLAAISALVTRQVVLPIRSAARIAGRFADGRLRERMLVRGEDDMARLAQAFNEMAESLSGQITQLEEFGNLQRRFTSDVSHELRTPLTTVRMAADLIHSSSDELDPALGRSAELLVNELDRFESLLNDLLEISRHDAGVAELQIESLDVRMCARAAISTVRHLAKEAGVEIIIDLPEDPLVAEVDPRRVERVLRNLLANAIDHSEGKPVLIRMRGDSEANAVAFVVRDQGVGLRPGEEKLVFNRFWRSDPSRMRRSGGTGLGLSISVEDANLHEGKLEAWGEIGTGASFRLTLPLVRGKKLGKSPLALEPPRRTLRSVEREALPASASSTVQVVSGTGATVYDVTALVPPAGTEIVIDESIPGPGDPAGTADAPEATDVTDGVEVSSGGTSSHAVDPAVAGDSASADQVADSGVNAAGREDNSGLSGEMRATEAQGGAARDADAHSDVARGDTARGAAAHDGAEPDSAARDDLGHDDVGYEGAAQEDAGSEDARPDDAGHDDTGPDGVAQNSGAQEGAGQGSAAPNDAAKSREARRGADATESDPEADHGPGGTSR